MRKRIAAVGTIAILCAIAAVGCRKGESEAPPPKATSAQPAAESGDTNFSPPEIRRPVPQESAVDSIGGTTEAIPGPTEHGAAPTPPGKKPVAATPAPSPAPAVKAAPKPVASVPPAPPKPVPAPTPAPGGSATEPGAEGDWVLQVNVHKSEAEASAQVAKLASEGIPAYSVVVPTEGGGLAGRYWRVRVGRFKSRAEAQSYGEGRILPRGLKFWIDRKSNETRMVGGN